MESQTTEKFLRLFGAAPPAVQARARAAYELCSANPTHPSLRFKKVHDQLPVYSARVDVDWHAVGVLREGTIIWFWIGPHDEYEKLLSSM